jgi:hypothetical protein
LLQHDKGGYLEEGRSPESRALRAAEFVRRGGSYS